MGPFEPDLDSYKILLINFKDSYKILLIHFKDSYKILLIHFEMCELNFSTSSTFTKSQLSPFGYLLK